MSAFPPQQPPTSLENLLNALVNAAYQTSQKGAQADAEEATKFAQAALSYSQAYVALHPGLVAPQGVAPQILNPPVPPAPPAKPKTKKVIRDGGGQISAIQES